MTRIIRRYSPDLLVLSTAIGLYAALSAPWLEFRGVFQAWRIVEWHTFWRGEGAFLLGDIVAPGYPIPIEYATASMRNLVIATGIVGAAFGGWHLSAALLIIRGWVRRQRARLSIRLAAGVVLATIAVTAIGLLLAWLLALPSNVSLKVDFRTPQDMHIFGLLWSEVTLLLIGPLLSMAAALVQVTVLVVLRTQDVAGVAERA